jgi:hypothetical protein
MSGGQFPGAGPKPSARAGEFPSGRFPSSLASFRPDCRPVNPDGTVLRAGPGYGGPTLSIKACSRPGSFVRKAGSLNGCHRPGGPPSLKVLPWLAGHRPECLLPERGASARPAGRSQECLLPERGASARPCGPQSGMPAPGKGSVGPALRAAVRNACSRKGERRPGLAGRSQECPLPERGASARPCGPQSGMPAPGKGSLGPALRAAFLKGLARAGGPTSEKPLSCPGAFCGALGQSPGNHAARRPALGRRLREGGAGRIPAMPGWASGRFRSPWQAGRRSPEATAPGFFSAGGAGTCVLFYGGLPGNIPASFPPWSLLAGRGSYAGFVPVQGGGHGGAGRAYPQYPARSAVKGFGLP